MARRDRRIAAVDLRRGLWSRSAVAARLHRADGLRPPLMSAAADGNGPAAAAASVQRTASPPLTSAHREAWKDLLLQDADLAACVGGSEACAGLLFKTLSGGSTS